MGNIVPAKEQPIEMKSEDAIIPVPLSRAPGIAYTRRHKRAERQMFFNAIGKAALELGHGLCFGKMTIKIKNGDKPEMKYTWSTATKNVIRGKPAGGTVDISPKLNETLAQKMKRLFNKEVYYTYDFEPKNRIMYRYQAGNPNYLKYMVLDDPDPAKNQKPDFKTFKQQALNAGSIDVASKLYFLDEVVKRYFAATEKLKKQIDFLSYQPGTYCPYRFTVVYLSITLPKGGSHANLFLVDHEKFTIEQFEPHGVLPKSWGIDQEWYNREIVKIVREIQKQQGKMYPFSPPIEVCPVVGPQSRSKRRGFCVAWTAMYFHLRMLNPEKSTESIINHMNRGGLSKTEFEREREKRERSEIMHEYISRYIAWAELQTPLLQIGVAEWKRDKPPKAARRITVKGREKVRTEAGDIFSKTRKRKRTRKHSSRSKSRR